MAGGYGKTWALVAAIFAVGAIFVVCAKLLEQEGEYRRVTSPDGRYVAIATFPISETMVMRFPGQSGDKRGFIRIMGVDGTNYGKVPVGMVQMIYDMRWEKNGASLCCWNHWNFKTRSFSYWNDAQTEKFVKRAK